MIGSSGASPHQLAMFDFTSALTFVLSPRRGYTLCPPSPCPLLRGEEMLRRDRLSLYLTLVFTRLSKIKIPRRMRGRFPILRSAFLISRKGFPILGRASLILGNGFLILGNYFLILGNGFRAFHHRLPRLAVVQKTVTNGSQCPKFISQG